MKLDYSVDKTKVQEYEDRMKDSNVDSKTRASMQGVVNKALTERQAQNPGSAQQNPVKVSGFGRTNM